MIDQRARPRTGVGAAATSALCGSLLGCAPPALPADTAAKRLADRLLPRPGWPACLYFVAVAALWTLGGQLSARPELGIDALASLAAGTWCSVNFWRCRHAHCLVTGVGWLALGALLSAETALGRSMVGGLEGFAFVGILGIGVAFELGWYLTRGSQVVPPRPRRSKVSSRS